MSGGAGRTAGRRGASSESTAHLPDEQRRALRSAVRLEWFSIGYTCVALLVVGVVAGQSQAMRAAWIEDALTLLPPIAFLIAVRISRTAATARFPYGRHRAIDVAHVVAATALLVMGLILFGESALALINLEKPPIGVTVLFGHAIWAGWLMVAAMAFTGVVPVILGRMKLRLARKLHDKVLYADADMNKADWSTALGTSVGVLGVGVGLWWADAAAAIVVAVSIIGDGVRNLRTGIRDLMDTRAGTLEGEPNPVLGDLDATAAALPWVGRAAARVREQGHVLHVEMFVVPGPGHAPTVAELEDARTRLRGVDWRVHDVVVVPVRELPAQLAGG